VFAFFVVPQESSRMFDMVRKHTKIMMAIMVLLIIPSFVLFGIDGYNRMRQSEKAVARVAGQDITQSQWDAAHKAQSDRLRASSPNLDPRLLDSPEARYAALEQLVRQRVLASAAEDAQLITSDVRLARFLQEDPTISSLRKPDGSLDMDRYRQLAASQGLTPQGFENSVRQDISLQQVEGGLQTSAMVLSGPADVSLNAYFEKRAVSLVRFAATDFASKVKPADSEVKDFYQKNQQLFQAPEQAQVQYVVLDLDSVKKGIEISESDLRAYYDQNAARLSGAEERRASHILITAPQSAASAERQKAKEKADNLLKQIQAKPESFADLAKKNSQDPGSASKGGDLDYFARGAMVKPFEDAAFAMRKGEISGVVESDFGYHIIQLTDIKSPKQKSFADLRANIEADLKLQQARRKFAEVAEQFTNLVYEQSDSLKPVADKLKLELQTAERVGRQPLPGNTGVLSNPKFLAALFSEDVLEKKHNTAAVETSANQLVAGRVIKYSPAQTLPFEEAQTVVRARLIAQGAAQLARTEGEAKLAQWKQNPSQAPQGKELVVSRDQRQDLEPVVLTAVLRADTTALPNWLGVDLGQQGYVVVRVNKVLPRDEAAQASAKTDRDQYTQMWTGAVLQAYYQLLKERLKVEMLVPAPQPAKAS
jgi:peptidyl-prolyl cis-trans isomerase D